MRSAKQSDSPIGYCRDVYRDRTARQEVRVLSSYEQRIRDREVAAERERLTVGVGRQIDPTGFCEDGWI